MVVVLWLIVIVVALLQLPPRAPIMNQTAGSDIITVAPPSNSNGPGDAGSIPLDAVSGTDLQGAAIPSDVINNLMQ